MVEVLVSESKAIMLNQTMWTQEGWVGPKVCSCCSRYRTEQQVSCLYYACRLFGGVGHSAKATGSIAPFL